MANFSLYFPKLLMHEGGYVDHLNDKGGATNLGVTLKVWIDNGYDKDGDRDIDKEDLRRITKQDAEKIAKKLYWDKIKGDQINSQSLAEFIFDWAYNSGVATATKKVQESLKLKEDGVMGPLTIAAINSSSAKCLFDVLKIRREKFFKDIVASNPSQRVFLNGWMNRLNSFTFKS